MTNETPEHLSEIFVEYFDRILVDAPCSGEGMFRKNEDAMTEWSKENVTLCAERQDGILSHAASMLRPGGRLVYSTCTFAPEENEESISRFLEKHPEFSIVAVEKWDGMSAGVPEWISRPADGIGHTIRLWPHRLKGEGHYLAVLKKAGELPDDYRGGCRSGEQTGLKEKRLQRVHGISGYLFQEETDGDSGEIRRPDLSGTGGRAFFERVKSASAGTAPWHRKKEPV